MRWRRLTISMGVLLFGVIALSAFAMTGAVAAGDDTATVESSSDPGCDNANIPSGADVCIPDFNDDDTPDSDDVPDSDELEFCNGEMPSSGQVCVPGSGDEDTPDSDDLEFCNGEIPGGGRVCVPESDDVETTPPLDDESTFCNGPACVINAEEYDDTGNRERLEDAVLLGFYGEGEHPLDNDAPFDSTEDCVLELIARDFGSAYPVGDGLVEDDIDEDAHPTLRDGDYCRCIEEGEVGTIEAILKGEEPPDDPLLEYITENDGEIADSIEEVLKASLSPLN